MRDPAGGKADSGRRYRAYPTPEQAERLAGWGHSCRAIWNLAVEQRQYLYRHRGVTLGAGAQSVQLTQARVELPWLADLPAQSAQQVLRQLDRAYDNWWNPRHPAGPPTFKKRQNRLAVPFPGQAIKVHKLNGKWAQVRLPKVGWVRFRLSSPLGASCATPRSAATGWAGTSPSGWRQVPGRRGRTACLAAGSTSGWPVRRTSRMSPHPGYCRRY
jgi:putative transposase